MDDTGLQAQPTPTIPPVSEPPVTPQPNSPSMPPVPPSPTITSAAGAPPPSITPENPSNIQPVNPASAATKTFKKNAKKIIGGALMVMLLAAGVWVGKNEVQKKQTVEQQAAGIDFTCTEQNAQQNLACRNVNATWTGGWCVLNICPKGDTDNDTACSYPLDEDSTAEYGPCFSQIIPKARSLGTTCYQFDTIISPTNFGWCDLSGPECIGYEDNFDVCVPQSPSPSPSPSVSPAPTMSCVDLTKDKDNPAIGDTVTFTCEANFSGVSPVAFFRYSKDNEASWSNPAPNGGVPINASTHKANYDINIDATGTWVVQCQVCTEPAQGAAGNCTEWGRAS